MTDYPLPPCPTPCDDDCELNPDGCHESHVPNHGNKRSHQPHGCEEIRRAIAGAVAAERERLAAYLARRGNELASNAPEPFTAAAAITHFDIAQTIREGTDG